jgi:hypothetical protein
VSTRRRSGDGAGHRASATSVRLIKLAIRVLPNDGRRERYRAEFVAELHGMTRARQTRHALSIVVHAWALRTAVMSSPRNPLEVAVHTTRKPRPLLCRMNLRHRWKGQSTEDGCRYLRCSRCGKDHSGGGPTSGGDKGYWIAAAPGG